MSLLVSFSIFSTSLFPFLLCVFPYNSALGNGSISTSLVIISFPHSYSAPILPFNPSVWPRPSLLSSSLSFSSIYPYSQPLHLPFVLLSNPPSLTASDSFIFMVILLTASAALLTIRRSPALLRAWVLTARGNWTTKIQTSRMSD